MGKDRLAGYFIFFVCILLVIFQHAYGFFGHYGFDDLHYARLSKLLWDGQIDYNDHYSFRLAVLLPTALSYALFGVSDFASALPPMICTILILYLVQKALKEEALHTQVIGLALTVCSNWFLYYSDKLMPDIYVALSVMLAVFAVDRYKFNTPRSHPQFYALALVGALGLGWLAKETIVLTIPMLLGWGLADWRQRRDWAFWKYTLLYGILGLAAYFALIWISTGDFAQRLNAIANNSYLNACSYERQSTQVLLKRLYYDFFALLTTEAILPGLVFILAALFHSGGRHVFALRNSFAFYTTSAILLFLASNFMSISLTAYVPMCLDPRHYLFLIPVAAIPAAKVIGAFLENKKYALPIVIGLLVAASFLYWINQQTFNRPYLGLFLLFGSAYFLPLHRPVFKSLFVLVFLFIMLIGPYHQWQYARKVQYAAQKAVVYDYVVRPNESCYIITDPVQKRLGEYYGGFNPQNNYRFLSFDEVDFTALSGRKIYLLLNWHTRYLTGLNDQDLPHYVRHLDEQPAKRIVYKNQELNMFIYELQGQPVEPKMGQVLLQSVNDFESPQKYWDQNDADLSSTKPYQGKNAYRYTEFSATFNFPLDSLPPTESTVVRIAAKAMLKVSTSTQAKMSISIETPTEAYNWQAIDLTKYLKVYDNWWPVKFETALKLAEVKPNSRLKVYLWNEDRKTAEVDNFEVKIIRVK